LKGLKEVNPGNLTKPLRRNPNLKGIIKKLKKGKKIMKNNANQNFKEWNQRNFPQFLTKEGS